MEYIRLSDCSKYSSLRTKNITAENYISTENMLPDKGGIVGIESIPDVKSASKYEINDILLSNIRPYFKKIWHANCEGSCSNDVLVVKTTAGYSSKFVYYVLCDNNFFNYATVTAKGTKMPRGSKDAIMKYLVPRLDIDTQERIASILSTYDDLIENNNRRIRILEQMAENLYKEWFVRFRFPGHSRGETKQVKPKGWVLSSNSAYIECPKSWGFNEFIKIGKFVRGKNITADNMITGEIPVISAGIEPSGYHNACNVNGQSITISASGANAGYLKYHQISIWAADCSYCQDSNKLWFLYHSLKFLQPVISNMQTGAAQPHVYPKHINKLYTIIPDEEILLKFQEVVSPIYDSIKLLREKNTNLTKQRDMLLPHLMSGKLEV